MNACNQKSNREPVVNYDEDMVETALDGLRDKGPGVADHRATAASPSTNSASRECNLGRREAAVMCVLMLRGPQTVANCAAAPSGSTTFDDLEAVESTLHRLAEMDFVKQLPRQSGYKEPRWAQLLAGDVESDGGSGGAMSALNPSRPDRERISTLEQEVAGLNAPSKSSAATSNRS